MTQGQRQSFFDRNDAAAVELFERLFLLFLEKSVMIELLTS
jgi:hypothetical protein